MNSTTTSSSLFSLSSHLRGAASAIMIGSSLALLPSAASGQNIDTFMKIEGIKGESSVPGHRDDINVIGFAMGVDRPLVYGAAKETLGTPQFFEVRVSKSIDTTSPLLFVGCATGQVFPAVTLSLSRIDSKGGSKKPFDFFRVNLTNVTITRVTTGETDETGTGGTQNEELTLSFQKIEWVHRSESPSGKVTEVKRGFDLGLNVPTAVSPR